MEPLKMDSPLQAAEAKDMDLREGDFVIRDFRFQSGETLPELRIHYMTMGTPRRDTAGRVINAVLLVHGTNGGGHIVRKNFGGALFQRGQPLDSEKFYLVIPDAIGCGASSKPSDGLRGRFPRYGYNDMVEAQRLLLTQCLGVDHMRLVIGLSMGAMHAWIWGGKYPDMMDGLVPLVALPKPIAGHNLLW